MTDRQTEEFVREGMSRYGRAAHGLVTFGQEVDGWLQAVLMGRSDWGAFKPKEATKPRSTHYWSKYPLLNARIDGELRGKSAIIQLSVNWYQSDRGYPFYCVAVEPRELLDGELSRRSQWPQNIEYEEGQLRLWPDPEDFDLERECGRLLDVFVACLTEGPQ